MRLIDADALEELFRETIGHIAKLPEIGKDLEHMVRASAMAVEMIQDAPTVGGWISVKDRLPEEHADEHPYEFEQYLCATVWNDVQMIGFGTRIGDEKPHFWSGNSIWDDRVTHWMPLPEPPKEEGIT